MNVRAYHLQRNLQTRWPRIMRKCFGWISPSKNPMGYIV